MKTFVHMRAKSCTPQHAPIAPHPPHTRDPASPPGTGPLAARPPTNEPRRHIPDVGIVMCPMGVLPLALRWIDPSRSRKCEPKFAFSAPPRAPSPTLGSLQGARPHEADEALDCFHARVPAWVM